MYLYIDNNVVVISFLIVVSFRYFLFFFFIMLNLYDLIINNLRWEILWGSEIYYLFFGENLNDIVW